MTAPDFRTNLTRLMERAELVDTLNASPHAAIRLTTKFLELAVNGHADIIVTGDRDLLALNPFRDVTPAAFVPGAIALRREMRPSRKTFG